MKTLLEIDEIPENLLIAKGKYSELRRRHRKLIESVAIKTGTMNATTGAISRAIREGTAWAAYLEEGKAVISELEQIAKDVSELECILSELRPIAWPKGEE